MSRPPPEADPEKMHPTQPVGAQPPAALLEAYKKHAQELGSIEDRQYKIIVLLLGIFSAAATLLLAKEVHVDPAQKIYVSVVAFLATVIGQHVINELHDLRIAVRDLLVRCEIGLGFYEDGAFLKVIPLYTDYEGKYHTRGGWTRQYYLVVWLALTGLVLLLICKK